MTPQPHTCPACKKDVSPAQYPALFRFSETERAMRGKNEHCPHCNWILWIEFAPDSQMLFTGADTPVYVGGTHAIVSPMVVLEDHGTRARRL